LTIFAIPKIMPPVRGGKDRQLQIRVTAAEKAAIHRAAARAGMDMSRWVLSKLFPPWQPRFQELTQGLTADPTRQRFVLAELNDFLCGLGAAQFALAVAEPPASVLGPYLANYVAAMVETAAHRGNVRPPAWTTVVPPLDEPAFGTPLPGLRLHLLLTSPPAFRRRNIFVDASIGDRV
jgi:hypothetical protein